MEVDRDKLTVKDLPSLINLLHDTSSVWESIATGLGLSGNDIACIRQDWDRAADRFREVLRKWLKGLEPSREKLAAVLQSPPVARHDLAEKVLPGIPHQKQPSCIGEFRPRVCVPILFAMVSVSISSVMFSCNQYDNYACIPIPSRRSLSLPEIAEGSLIGRKGEMDLITGYLRDGETRVLSLFGLVGLGKSTVAIHVGHRMLKVGWDVHYIRVEGITGVEVLIQTLMDISHHVTLAGARIMEWAKTLNRTTLLILDNVDRHWVKRDLKEQFQTNFVSELLQYSSQIRMLITSQEKIVFYSNFRYYQLTPLSVENCAQLASGMPPGSDPMECETLCSLVGNIPLAIKVLTSILKSREYTMNDIIQRLKDREKKFQFIRFASCHVEDRIIAAIEVAFDSLKPDYQVCSLLVVKYKYPLEIEYDVISGTMDDLGFKDFYTQDCLHELASKSFLKHLPMAKVYLFDPLIDDFLSSSLASNKHNMTKLRTFFWKNVLDRHVRTLNDNDVMNHRETQQGPWFWAYKLGIQDVEALTRVLDQNLFAANNTVVRILTHYFVIEEVSNWGHRDYFNNKVPWLLSRAENLQLTSKGDRKVMDACAAFYSYPLILAITQDEAVAWKPALFRLVHRLVTTRDECLGQSIDSSKGIEFPGCKHDGGVTSTVLGLELYALMKDEKALDCLHVALKDRFFSWSGCREVHNALVHIVLYDIHSRRGDQRGINDSIAGVKSNMQHPTGVCHSYVAIYFHIVIPFLKYVGETDLANKLRSLVDDVDVVQCSIYQGSQYGKVNLTFEFLALVCRGVLNLPSHCCIASP